MIFSYHLSKGNQVNIPEPGYGYFYGNVNELGDVSKNPRKSYLFFLTNYHLEIELIGDKVQCWVKLYTFRKVWCVLNDP
jgi:hypothetical protein